MKQIGISILAGAVLASIASIAPRTAAADTILSFDLGGGSVLAGNPVVPVSAFCITTANCPGTAPPFSLGASEPLSGTVSFDVTTGAMSFDLSLTQNAVFGGLTVDEGSTFVMSPQLVTFGSTKKNGVTTYTFSPGTSAETVTANLILPSGFTETASTPTMPGIECSATPASGSCSLLIGTPLTGAEALTVAQGATPYNGVLSISTNLTPVPLPASLWLMIGGLGCLVSMSRRRGAPRSLARFGASRPRLRLRRGDRTPLPPCRWQSPR
ncbi:MAG TPA: VPLPA-CTERM sorting domain-containing protein [Steroidobacteraceae bacterium]|jgi:hypothetical protein